MTAETKKAPLSEVIKQIPDYDPYRDIYDPDTGEALFYFDEEAAQEAVDFFPNYLTFTKGEWMGDPFHLGEWQEAIVANIFGWKRFVDDTRRYREVFFYVPRKNGKTELMGGIGNYVYFCDGEPGAECYSAAANEEQAMIVWNVAREMIEANPELDQCVRIYKKSIVMDTMGSFFKPITADAKSKHGFSVHLCLYDELHAAGSAELSETIETAQAARRQPLIVYMTTADEDRVSICNDKLDYAEKVRDGIFNDPAFLPIIYQLPKDADWHDIENWKKVNPNWGISVKADEFKRQHEKAKREPRFEGAFRRLRLNTVTQKATRWIDMLHWDKCKDLPNGETLERLLKQDCYGGLDLSSTIDTTAFVLFFPESKRVLYWFWIPEDTALERQKADRVPYLMWQNKGFIEFTPGNRVDYSYIEAKIIELSKMYNIKGLAYDPWGATQIAIALQDQHGIPMIEFRQGFRTYSEPCKKIEIEIAKRNIKHDGSPVMRWQASNAVTQVDAADNIKPNKEKSADKIDGVCAMVMAYGVWAVEHEAEKNVYNSRDMKFIDFDDDDDDYEDDDDEDDDY